MAAVHTFQLEGTFSLAELDHIAAQVKALPFDTRAELTRLGYADRYDYEANQRLESSRRFKGSIRIIVEETPHVPVPTKEEWDAAHLTDESK